MPRRAGERLVVPGHPDYEPFSVDLNDVLLYVNGSDPAGEAKLNRTLELLQASNMIEFEDDGFTV